MSRRRVRVPSDYASLPRTRLVELVAKLVAEIRALEKENEELQRAAKRQTARFSKGKKKGEHKKPGRKKGKGRFERRPPPAPEEITDRVTVPAPDICPNCGEITAGEHRTLSSQMTNLVPLRTALDHDFGLLRMFFTTAAASLSAECRWFSASCTASR